MVSIRATITNLFRPIDATPAPGNQADGQRVRLETGAPADTFFEGSVFDVSQSEKAISASVSSPDGFLNSITLRFGGFGRQFSTLIEPIGTFSESDPKFIRSYFENSLSSTINLAYKRPQEAQRLLSKKIDGETGIYERLVSVACGNSSMVLPLIDLISRSNDLDEGLLLACISEVSKFRPYEGGHLLTSLFNRASLKTKLEIIQRIVHSTVLGDKHIVGDMFVSLLSASAGDERKNVIYPGLLSIIDKAPTQSSQVKVKSGFLMALLHGWMSED